jgi:hypothetical protein
MNKLPLHKRGLEWLTSHALWELGKHLFGALSAGVVSYGISRIAHAALGTTLNIFLVLIGVMGIGLWVFGLVRRPTASSKVAEAKWDVFIFSPGVAVRLTPSTGSVMIHLHFLSTQPTELIFLYVSLRNNKGASLDCENSEPIPVGAMEFTSKMVQKTFPPQELATFEKGEMVNLDGYLKFRDGNSIRQVRIEMTTIPSM